MNRGYSIKEIASVVKGNLTGPCTDLPLENLAYDSRRIGQASVSVFFALHTAVNDGHHFIAGAYRAGVRNFVVQHVPAEAAAFDDACFVIVPDTLAALQQLAAYHRRRFQIPVIGITGSNGKTVVKEWLFQVLQSEIKIIRSPRSFNSQLGVPLSVWQLSSQYEMGIFEAGISKPGEMQQLQEIIQPTIGILTNIAAAHDEGFHHNRDAKLQEKLKLFSAAEMVIGREEDILPYKKKGWLSWGRSTENDFIIEQNDPEKITISFRQQRLQMDPPFRDAASIENIITVSCTLLALGYTADFISEGMKKLHPIDMRLQLKQALNNCIVINDSYSTDITSLRIALDFQKQQAGKLSPVLVLSDFVEAGKDAAMLYREIRELLVQYALRKIILIGEDAGRYLTEIEGTIIQSFSSTEDFLHHGRSSEFMNEIILVKGARKFEFEKIVQWLERRMHQTVLEVNLDALVHNLKAYQRVLQPGTGIMAMVKAFSYGSGGAEIASVLQYHNVKYLGVAYADEGAELVKSGISLPIMVLNAEEAGFQQIVDHNLQPAIFSFELLESFDAYLQAQGLNNYPVHIEVETGMNRLGFLPGEIAALKARIAGSASMVVASVFSHLAASEDPAHKQFTMGQAEQFIKAADMLQSGFSYKFLRHLSNSAGIIEYPELQMDMVRLGIGLYGIEVDSRQALDLQPVASLRTTISQIKHIRAGESVSYNRRGIVSRDSVIGTVRVGYADGYSRSFSNGRGWMLVKGRKAPVVGSVCMDMTMLDLTDIPGVKTGDEVVVFGSGLPVQEIAGWIGTIPYEILTGISQRVKRVYFHE